MDPPSDVYLLLARISYERENITAWLASHDTSPLTNETLPHKMVVPNHSLKALIWGFRDP